jgi:hypothetical protein
MRPIAAAVAVLDVSLPVQQQDIGGQGEVQQVEEAVYAADDAAPQGHRQPQQRRAAPPPEDRPLPPLLGGQSEGVARERGGGVLVSVHSVPRRRADNTALCTGSQPRCYRYY